MSFVARRSWDGHAADDHARAVEIVAAHGADPLAPFARRADKAYFFFGDGLLAYRTIGRTAVVSSDPVAPEGEAPLVLEAFLAFAAGQGWDVAVAAAGPDHLEAYRALGLHAVQVGAESVVDPRAFTLEGRAVRKVRQSVNRVIRRGWSVDVLAARALDEGLLREISAAEEDWRAENPCRSGFAMSMDRLWGAPEDLDDVYVLGRDPDGRLRSFLRFVPYRAGLSLDAMRRPADAPNGLMEALVVGGLEHARAAGLAEVSLNFAGFAHVMGDPAGLSGRERLLRFALSRLRGHFQLDRLIHFNEKFSPRWRPRYLVYTRRRRLASAGLRVLQAESYVPAPRPRRPEWGWDPRPVPVLSEAIS